MNSSLLVYVLPCVCTPLPLHGMQYSQQYACVYYYLLSFMNKEIIMKWVIQMSIRWAIITVCAVVNYIYFWQCVVQYICMYLYISALYIEYVCMYCSIYYVAMVLYSSVQQRTSSIVVQQYMIILKGNQIMKIRHILVVVVAAISFFYAVDFVGQQLDKEYSCYHTSKGLVCDK